jgi:hypothetical protein
MMNLRAHTGSGYGSYSILTPWDIRPDLPIPDREPR